MWPFKKTLSERYSKLVKLIKSIDPNFQMTENKEDSLRLHLPNYKGNQPMDFHIYLMEPFLFISFITEIEGEKISCLNNFPQDTDQQDMFNVAMAANLEKIHQILDEKYNKNTEDNKADTKREKKKEGAKELTEEQRYALYYYVHSFTTPMYYNGNDNTPSLILRMYKKTLGLSDYDVEYIIKTPLYRISEHLENLKSIDDTTTINTFLYSCVTIIDKAESGAAITNFLGIVQDLGISEEKLKDIIRTIEPTSCEHFFDRDSSDIWDNLDEEDTEELSSKTVQCETDGDASSDEVNSLNYFFDFDESYKKHILTIMALRPGLEFHYYKPKTHNPLWKYKGELLDSHNPNPIGCSAFAWIMQHYEEKEDFCYLLDFLGLDCMGKKYLDLFASTAYKDAEEMIYDIKRNVPSFKLGNDPQKVQPIIHQTWMDLIAIDNFIDYCSNSLDNLKGRNQSPKQLCDCSSIEDLALLFLLEFKVETGCHSAKIEENTSSHNSFEEPAIVNWWSLLDFARAHGKMKRIPSSSHIISETGEEELSAAYCIFVHPTNKDEQGNPIITAIVSFSQELGELTAKEIGEQKDNLIVAEYESGNYSLKRKEVVEEEKSSTENTDKDLFITQLNNCSFEKIFTCANNLLLSLVNCKLDEVDRKLLVAELTILSSAMVLDTKDEKISHWYNFVEKRILDYYLSIKEVTNYDDWIESNTPGMCSNDLYTTEEAIPLAEFERNNGQIKFYRGQINAYPYDDSFWGELINKNGQKQIIYVDQGFPFEYNTTDILNRKSDFGIVEEKDTYYHSEEVFYCLKEIRSRHSMLSSYVKKRFTFYKKAIGEILANHNNDKAQIFQLYNAVTNERLNFNVPYLGIDYLVFNDETVINDETGEMYQYDATSLSYFSKCIEDSLAILYQGIKNSVPNFDLVMEDNQSIEYDCFRNDVTGNEMNNAWTDEYGAQYSADKRKLLYVPDYIEEYSIAEGTKEIGDFAFVNIEHEDVDYNYIMENNLDIHDFERYTSKLVSVYIPNSIVRIGKGIFDYCTKLEIINIPKGTTDKFKQLLPDYEDIFVEGDIATKPTESDIIGAWEDEYGAKYSNDKRKLLKVPNGLVIYGVKEGTVVICDGAFFECTTIEIINIPTSLVVIGNYAFFGCTNLKEICLSPSIKKIGDRVFDSCERLKSIYVFENEIFRFRKMLPDYKMLIQKSPVNSILDEYGVAYDLDYKRVNFNTKSLAVYAVRNGTEEIESFAFKPYDWNNDNGKTLKKIILPDSIIKIGAGAFEFNEGLEYINIPKNSSFMIEENPFAGCVNLHTIKWETQYAIKEGTLIFNHNYRSLIACLGWHYKDNIVQSWSFNQFEQEYGKMQVGEFVDDATGEHTKKCIFTKAEGASTLVAFHYNTGNLSYAEIACMRSDLKVVKLDTEAFLIYYGETIIKPERRVVLTEGLESISNYAFYGNKILEEVTLPSSIMMIGKHVFDGCSNLKVIYVPKGQTNRFAKWLPEWENVLKETSFDSDLPF